MLNFIKCNLAFEISFFLTLNTIIFFYTILLVLVFKARTLLHSVTFLMGVLSRTGFSLGIVYSTDLVSFTPVLPCPAPVSVLLSRGGYY